MIEDPIPWPEGCRCAVAVTFDMDADSTLHLARRETVNGRVAAASALGNGPEASMARILRIFRDVGLWQTLFITARCIERYPATIEGDSQRRTGDRSSRRST